MAKQPKVGKCVHCLKDPVELTSDHMFPQAWYPDTTPENLEKWQMPSCAACNNRYSKIEGELLNRVAFALDTKHPASSGLIDAALRAINPDAGRNEKDAAARAAQGKKILGDLIKGEAIPDDAIMPGLGDRWDQQKAEQVAVRIPKDGFTAMTEKIVRGLVYRENGSFVVPPYKIQAYVADEEGAKICKELLDKAGRIQWLMIESKDDQTSDIILWAVPRVWQSRLPRNVASKIINNFIETPVAHGGPCARFRP